MKKLKTKTEKKIFCRNCGRRCIRVYVPAEKVTFYNFGGSYNPYGKYDSETGERQCATYLKCPKENNWIFNHHDTYEYKAEII